MATDKTTNKQDKFKNLARQVMGVDVNERQKKNTAIFNPLPKDIVSKALSATLDSSNFSREISKLSQNLPGEQLQKAVEEAMAPSKALSTILETQGFSREISRLSQNLPGAQLQKAMEEAKISLTTLSTILETQGFSREISKLSQDLPSEQFQKAIEAAMAPSKAIKDAMRGLKTQSNMQQMVTDSVSNMRSLPPEQKMLTTKNLYKNQPSIHYFNNVVELGKAVRRTRKSKGITQQKFADLAGVGRRFLSELEQGKQTLEIGKVIKVASAAGIQLAFTAVDAN